MEFPPSSIKIRTFFLFLILVLIIKAEEQKYTTKYDNVDVDEVLKSERLVSNYVGCLMDKNPCTPDAAELKSKIFKISAS